MGRGKRERWWISSFEVEWNVSRNSGVYIDPFLVTQMRTYMMYGHTQRLTEPRALKDKHD